MCVVALALDRHPRWKIVLAGNRDELHARPSQPIHRWKEAGHVIAGRDIQAGGSWLGVSEQGRMAVVTNIRNEEGPDLAKFSRGSLVRDWLVDGIAPERTTFSSYNPFNLLLLGGRETLLHSNRPEAQSHSIDAGIHGLSNGHPGESWPRRDRMISALAQWIELGGDEADLFKLLADEQILDDGGHPIFIRGPVYGTRCSTAILVDHHGQGTIAERRFDPDALQLGATRMEFDWGGLVPR